MGRERQPPPVAEGDRTIIDGEPVEVVKVTGERDGVVDVIVRSPSRGVLEVSTTFDELRCGRQPSDDGRGGSEGALAALWAYWMRWATPRIRSSVTATRPLQPYAHQDEAVFEYMLGQPRLRFLLADEPGTGKTIMTGMYLVEGKRQGVVKGNTLVVPPAHLVSKWMRDLRRLFGIEAEQITSEMARGPLPLRPDVDVWVVSLDLFTHNPDVHRRVSGDEASWSLLVFDEAHRLTPTSQYLDAAWHAAQRTHHLLLLTATPHRGKEWLFRNLLHLLDPEIYPLPDKREVENSDRPLIPSKVHFLRRMKEELVDNSGEQLFPRREAATKEVQLTPTEERCYEAVMGYVDEWYADSTTLAPIIYSKRAASSMHAAAETLRRRRAVLSESQRGKVTPPAPFDPGAGDYRRIDDDEAWEDAETSVLQAGSRDRHAELAALDGLIAELDEWLGSEETPAKWRRLQDVLAIHDIAPGRDQLLVFTEYTDTATWLKGLFQQGGFATEVLSGDSSHPERDELQARFLDGKFQVLVSTDAGGEGIDLQSANVMVDWDVPWSLVRLEQRAGRLHRIGQHRPVHLYHLVAPQTREGRVQQVMLENIEAASAALNGRIFDVLDAAVAGTGFSYEQALVDAQRSGRDLDDILPAVPSSRQLIDSANENVEREDRLAAPADTDAALARFQHDRLEAVNPVMVDGFVRRLATVAGWDVRHGPAEHILDVAAGDGALPEQLGGDRRTRVAVSADAVERAREHGADIRDAVTLGPTETAFAELVQLAIDHYGLDLQRGARTVDYASLTSYTLFVYAAEVDVPEGATRHRRALPIPIRHSAAGAVKVAWESVANLYPTDQVAHAPAPAARHEAEQEANAECQREEHREQKLREETIERARRSLRELETRVTQTIQALDEDARRKARQRFEADKQQRLADLEELTRVRVSPPRLVGWVQVEGAGRAEELGYDPDSEQLAVAEVVAELEREGFKVDDRQTAGLGYDLLAVRQRTREQRLVEVKGQLHGLSAVTLESHEWGQAMQRAGDYWLYVVTGCAIQPTITVRLQDPAGQLGGPTLIERFEIPVSELRPHAQ